MNSQGWTPHQSPSQCIQEAEWFPPPVQAFPSPLLLLPASKEASDSCGVHLELLARHCSLSDGWEPDCCQNIHQATSHTTLCQFLTFWWMPRYQSGGLRQCCPVLLVSHKYFSQASTSGLCPKMWAWGSDGQSGTHLSNTALKLLDPSRPCFLKIST